MGSEKLEVNETHICVLRRKESIDELFVDFVKLEFPFQDQLNELKNMSENSNRSILELQDYVMNSKLNILLISFNFCKYLSGSWQSCSDISIISNADYREKISIFNQKIEEAKNEEEKERDRKLKQEFIDFTRIHFYRKIEEHTIPYLLDLAYKELEEDENVLAYSHRCIGWSKPKFSLSDDISVIYKTNFGYGNSSYFYTHIKYKGIDILPYSDWIYYYYADQEEIIRYTRRHLLNNNEWIKTMDFTSEIYNSSVREPNVFVEKWIINEVDEMVKGLEKLFNIFEGYKVIDSYFARDKSIILEGRDLMRFKGEKISGALVFLEKLKELDSIYPKIEIYIERVVNSNMGIYPQLVEEVKLIEDEIIDLNKNLFEIALLKEEYRIKVNDINEERQKNYEKVKHNPKYPVNYATYSNGTKVIYLWDIEAEKLLKKNIPDYEMVISKFQIISNEYNLLVKRISNLLKIKNEINKYTETIYKYFVIIDRVAELIA